MSETCDIYMLPDIQGRLKWDFRFVEMAAMVASWSKDPSTKCGAVIVRPDKSVVSVGFNGFPRGCSDDPEIYADRPRKYSRVVHAEVNAVIATAEQLHGYSMYTYPGGASPTCDRCAAVVIQSGITRIVHPAGEFGQGRWDEAMKSALEMYAEAGVTIEHLECK